MSGAGIEFVPNLTKVSGTGIGATPNLPEDFGRVLTDQVFPVYVGTYPAEHTLGCMCVRLCVPVI